MIKILEKYLKDYETRSNITVISEVLSALIIDKYILKNNVLNIGDSQQEKLPDIHTQDKIWGFEVTRCESDRDFCHDDVQKFFESINYNYEIFKKINNAKTYDEVSDLIDEELFKKIKKYKIRVTIDNNRITSSTNGIIFHDIFWLKDVYLTTLTKKLEKLNSGNYSACSNISLILVMMSRPVGIQQANIIKDIYSSIQSDYQRKFKRIYLFTMNNIFEITNEEIKMVHHYKNEEFNNLVDAMKNNLQIHEYKTI